MEASSQPPNAPARSLPDGVNPEALYDGPNVHRLASGRGAFLPPTPETLSAPIPQSPQGPALAALPGPQTAVVVAPATAPPPVPVSQTVMKRDYPQVVALAMDVLSARLLGLIALVAMCGLWGVVVWDPDPKRIAAAGIASLTVFLPIMVIYWRAGLTGEGG